jgi:radical SAM superfamily enzyme YgiQ (UPF0313 family)
MRIVLVDNLVMPEAGALDMLDVHPHLGLLSLAAVAKAEGHEVSIYDPKRLLRQGRLPYEAALYELVARDLLASAPDAVGFTTLGCSFLFALNTAAALKRREPELPILLGGPHATMLHREILERFTQFDAIVRYEADETFPAVLAGLERRGFDAIPGISWRGAGGALHATEGKPKVEDLDRLPLLDYDLYPIAELGLDLMRIEAGRGCPFACTFCSTATFFQRSFRLKSASRLVLELDRLHARYGLIDFKLDHDLFTVNRRKILEFCEAVEDRGYRWRASARVDCVDQALLERMARAGCSELYFGIEAGSARMQEIAKKRLDLTLVVPTLAVAAALGIETTASFITGYPQELRQDQDETLDLLGRCAGESCLAQLHILTPEPGTPLFDAFGGAAVHDGHANPFNAHLMGEDDRALIHGHPDVFSTYYHYPAALPRAAHLFAVAAVDALRHAGPVLMRYALRAFDGRLSLFVHDWRDWAARDATPDTASLLAFVTGRFGATHHMTSLFRFALSLHRARDGGTPTASDDADARYSLDRRWQVLPALHDCAALISAIRAAPDRLDLLSDAEAGGQCTYLAGVSDGMPVSCELDAGMETILNLFGEPRTLEEVSRLARGRRRRKDEAVLRQLVEAGILTRSARPAREPAGNG